MDRGGLARAVYGQVDSRWPVSDSAIYLPGTAHYQPNWNEYRFRPGEAQRLLEQEGCRRGSDGIYVCEGGRLSLRLATVAGFPARQQALEGIQRQLRQVGIDIVPVYVPGNTLFNEILPSGSFDLAMFTYITSPDGPGTSFVSYGCGGEQNYSGYCQRLLSRDLDQAQRILDASRQARLLNRVDAQLAKDVPVIPLYQNPVVAAGDSSVRGVRLGVFWTHSRTRRTGGSRSSPRGGDRRLAPRGLGCGRLGRADAERGGTVVIATAADSSRPASTCSPRGLAPVPLDGVLAGAFEVAPRRHLPTEPRRGRSQ